MKIEIFDGIWTIDDVSKYPDKLFVFADNNVKLGKTELSIIRELPNAIGLRVKKGPSTKPAAFYTDKEFLQNTKNIREDILFIKNKLIEGKTVVFSSYGYGTGQTKLAISAPKTFDFLNIMLRSYFGFDNLTGKKWFKLPGYDEIVNGKYLNFNKTNSSIIQPINNSFFDKELLSKNLNSTFDLIKSENKISFISDVLHNNSDILILVFENQPDYLVCRVVDSYEASLISKNMLYKFEGFDDSFEFDIYGLYQTQIEFISTLDQSGKMIYKDKFFTDYENVKNITDKKIVGEKIIKQDMKQDEIIEILKDLQKRVEKIENKKLFKNPFKKSLETLLTEKKLLGEITMVDSSNYQVKKDDEYLLIKFKKGLFTNSIELILKSKNPIV